ncbi:hypothetical protein Nepgr_023554 [Nepenthes gracilis]|uniref:Uncharacterized protein n=1 Tax=Nepenthes gracilis TaxID=150966 RepID=A0AAD3T2R1_NEPGR|nr:hypothetical protein Nepgr_023554 [Nepenthes gracilis]
MDNEAQPIESIRTTAEDRRIHQRDGQADEEDDLRRLEEEVKEMAQKLMHYRSTLSNHLKSTLTSILAAQRQELPLFDDGSEPEPSKDPNSGSHGDSGEEGMSMADDKDHEIANKIQLLKDKISSNVSAMPIVLKRMNECISRIDKLNSCNGTIHPAFKRKKS